MKNRLTLTAVAVSFLVAAPLVASAQVAGAYATDGSGSTVYGSSGPVAFPALTGAPQFGGVASDDAGASSAFGMTPGETRTVVTNRTSSSTASQTSDSFEVTTSGNAVRLGPVGTSVLRTNAATTNNSGLVAVDNGIAVGNFQKGVGSQRNGSYPIYGSGVDLTATGAFQSTGILATGLLTDGVAGTNTLLGTTATNGITNTGNVNTSTLAVTGTATTNGIVNTGNVSTTTLTTGGNATVGGTLSVTGPVQSNGIVNAGNVSTTTLNTTGNASVGGVLTTIGLVQSNGNLFAW